MEVIVLHHYISGTGEQEASGPVVLHDTTLNEHIRHIADILDAVFFLDTLRKFFCKFHISEIFVQSDDLLRPALAHGKKGFIADKGEVVSAFTHRHTLLLMMNQFHQKLLFAQNFFHPGINAVDIHGVIQLALKEAVLDVDESPAINKVGGIRSQGEPVAACPPFR